jgi:hypothetical protein
MATNDTNKANQTKIRAPTNGASMTGTSADKAPTRSETQRKQQINENEVTDSDHTDIGDFGATTRLQEQVVQGNKIAGSKNTRIGQFSDIDG